MKRPSKTAKRIQYADGKTEIIRRVRGGWSWDYGSAISSHIDNVEFSVKQMGGIIETIDNPNYAAELQAFEREQARRNADPFAMLFGKR
jgi:hypothetical protein